MSAVKDRYVTYENIDCYKNAIVLLDALYELFSTKPESKNAYWVNFEEKLPQDYTTQQAKEGEKDILYLVCSNTFYMSDLFEEYDFTKGIELLDQAELECC